MNDNRKAKPVSNAMAVCWCMTEIGAFILGIAMAIHSKNTMWLFLSLGAFAMLMGGV